MIEEKVNKLVSESKYNKIDFKIDDIANYLGILVAYNSDIACFMRYRNYPIIHLTRCSKEEMWKDFTHELGHFMLHETDQLKTPKRYNMVQEMAANKFSLLFRMTQSQIEENELFTESDLMQFFNVTYEEANERLKLLCDYYCSDLVFL